MSFLLVWSLPTVPSIIMLKNWLDHQYKNPTPKNNYPKIFPIFIRVNLYTSHINLYDLAVLGILFTGLNFALLLGFTKKINRPANRFLAPLSEVLIFCGGI